MWQHNTCLTRVSIRSRIVPWHDTEHFNHCAMMRGYKRIGTQRGSDQSQPPPPLLPRPWADSTMQQRSNCDTSPRQKTDWQYGAWFLHSPGELTQGHSQDERVTACSTSLMLQCLKSNRGRLCDYTTHVRHGVSNPEQNRPMKWHRAF